MAHSRTSLLWLPVALATVALATTAHADPARPARVAPRRLASAELRAAHTALAEPLRAVVRAVPAREPSGGRVGAPQVPVSRTYRAQIWRTGARGAAEPARLRAVMRASLRPSPMDEVWYEEVQVEASPTVDRVVAAFGLEVSGLPAGEVVLPRPERAAIKELAERAIALVSAHPTLTLAIAQCGWADAVGGAYHGVMIFDRATGEVVWIHLDESWDAGE